MGRKGERPPAPAKDGQRGQGTRQTCFLDKTGQWSVGGQPGKGVQGFTWPSTAPLPGQLNTDFQAFKISNLLPWSPSEEGRDCPLLDMLLPAPQPLPWGSPGTQWARLAFLPGELSLCRKVAPAAGLGARKEQELRGGKCQTSGYNTSPGDVTCVTVTTVNIPYCLI